MKDFTHTVAERERLWEIRDGIFPCVAGARIPGDAVILEDVAAPVDRLDLLVDGLQQLFRKYGYEGAVFGHARDGNLASPDYFQGCGIGKKWEILLILWRGWWSWCYH